MKNRLIITLSDTNGSKSYNIHQILKKSIAVIVPLIVLIITGSFWFISILRDDIVNIKKEREAEVGKLLEEEKRLKMQNSLYSLQIQDKIKDIEELGSKLDEIEELIGIDGDDKSTLIQRATLAKIDTKLKTYMLQLIPSGSPTKEMVVTASYGYRNHPVKKIRQFHRGIDLRAKVGTPIYTTADGVVKRVDARNSRTGFGNVVVIAHGYGFETVYAHLSKLDVKLGDVVKKGQRIALSGNTGISTGPHLHYEIKYASKVLNPWSFIKWDIKNYEQIFQNQRRVEWESLVIQITNHMKRLEQL